MFANWQRRRLRASFSPLINQELPDREAARLRAAIDAEPALAAEYRRLEAALSVARTLPEVTLPSHFHAALDAELDLLDQPLRARYSDLLDGALRRPRRPRSGRRSRRSRRWPVSSPS